MRIREATPADLEAIGEICLRTGDNGGDASGLFCDDAVLADVYAVPYLSGPAGFALVVERDDAGARRARDAPSVVAGYVVGTSDTRAFQEWFSAEWWPERRAGRAPRTEGDRWLLPPADDPARMLGEWVDDYPAHLHIDLLPEVQGQGVGSRLIEAVFAVLRERGIPGVHVVASLDNVGAQAFYPRVGLVELGREEHTVTWGRLLHESSMRE